MKWIDKTNTFEERKWKDKYLEICEVLDDKIEVNLYSCEDINNYEIYVNYGIMYGIVYVHKNNAIKLREKIKNFIYDDYITNGYNENIPTDEFIDKFHKKYNIRIPSDIFFEESETMDNIINLFDNFN